MAAEQAASPTVEAGPSQRQQRLASLAQLEDGWDDDPATTAPSPLSLFMAADLLQRVEATTLSTPALFASAEGGISLEWASSGMTRFVEVTASDDGFFYVFTMTMDAPKQETTELKTHRAADVVDLLCATG